MNHFPRHPGRGTCIAVAAALYIGGCVASEPVSPLVRAFAGKDAKLVAHGVPPLAYRIPSAGNLAVLDKTTGQIVGFCSIGTPNQLLSIDPEDGNVILKNAADPNVTDMLAEEIEPTHEFEVYFQAIKAPPSQTVSKRPAAVK